MPPPKNYGNYGPYEKRTKNNNKEPEKQDLSRIALFVSCRQPQTQRHLPPTLIPFLMPKTDLNRAVSLCILPLFCAFLQEKRGYPTPENAILHPILHTKSPVITGILGYGCRKCRIFSKNFFCGERKREVTHRPGSHKTSDFFGQKYGCLPQRSPMFLISEKGKVLNTRLFV